MANKKLKVDSATDDKKNDSSSDSNKNLASSVSTLGSLAVKGLGAITKILGEATGAVLKFGGEFEIGMAKVSTIVDTSSNNMSQLSKGILSLSSASGTSASTLSETLYQSIAAGVKGTNQELLGFVDQINKLSIVGFTSTANAVGIVTTALDGYKLSTNDAQNVSDQLIMTQSIGKMTIDELGASLDSIIPTASAFGVNLGNVNTSLALMSAKGISTSQSTTYLKGMINELGNDGTKVAGILVQKTGKSFSQLMQEGKSLGDIMGILSDSVNGNTEEFSNLWSSSEAGNGALALLTSGTENFNSTLEQITQTTGATEEAYNKMTDTFENKVSIIQESAKNFGIAIFENVKEPLKDLADVGIEAISQLQESFEKDGLEGMLTTGAKLFVELLNGILQQLPGLIEVANQVITTFLTTINELSPELATAGVQILTILITTILENLPLLIDCCLQLITALGNSLAEQLPTLIPVVLQAVFDLVNVLIENLPLLVEMGGNLLFALVDGIMQALPVLITNAPQIITSLIITLLEMLPLLISLGAELLTKIIDGITSILANLDEIALTIANTIMECINNTDWMKLGSDILSSVISGLGSMINSLYNLANQIVITVIDAVSSLPSRMLSLGKDILGGLWDGIKGATGWLMDKINGFVDDVVEGICEFFDIFSPSHRMRDEVGKFLPSGIAVGFEKAMPLATDDMIDATSSGFKDLQNAAFAMNNRISLQPDVGTFINNETNVFDYERLGRQIAKYNDKVIVMDGQTVGKTVTNTVDREIGKETIKRGRYRA